jgi:hypothetical protein
MLFPTIFALQADTTFKHQQGEHPKLACKHVLVVSDVMLSNAVSSLLQ